MYSDSHVLLVQYEYVYSLQIARISNLTTVPTLRIPSYMSHTLRSL